MSSEPPLIFAGSASPRLAARICAALGIELARGEVLRYADGNVLVRALDSVRGRSVYVVQTIGRGANDQVVELLFWMDALRRAGAGRVTAVVPYFGYAKADRMDAPQASIRGRVVADAIQMAGADRLLTMDLHSRQIQGFFRIPVEELEAQSELAREISQLKLERPVVVAADLGFAKRGRAFAGLLKAPLAVVVKQRTGALGERVELVQLLGDVAGRDAVLVDDFTLTLGTLGEAARALQARGARSVNAAVTHALLAHEATARLDASPIARLFATDTVEAVNEPPSAKVATVTAAGLFAEAIRRLEENLSLAEIAAEVPASPASA